MILIWWGFFSITAYSRQAVNTHICRSVSPTLRIYCSMRIGYWALCRSCWRQGQFDLVTRPLSHIFFSLEVSFCASVEEDHKSCGLDAANLEQIRQVQCKRRVIELAQRDGHSMLNHDLCLYWWNSVTLKRGSCRLLGSPCAVGLAESDAMAQLGPIQRPTNFSVRRKITASYADNFAPLPR